ncbi:MAG: hypothetical protein WC758_07135 [Candidatus Woesearchaeota archaeon]|jgi:hypothetical protein
MYKNISPGLISFDTLLTKLPGFYYSDNFNSYSKTEKRSQFHYRVFIDDDIVIPREYDFRDAFFIKSKSKWYYERKLGSISLKFCFDPTKKTFSFNRIYTLIPFVIGNIFPVGLHIADFISLDLFLAGVTTFKGCAFNYNHRNVCVLAPSNNGKTGLIRKVLKKGGKYIAEDILLLDLQKNIVYPNYIRSSLFARKTGKWLKDLRSEELIIEPQSIDIIYLVKNSTVKYHVSQNNNIYDFFYLWRVPFNINPLLRSYVFHEHLRDKIDFGLSMFKKKKSELTFKQIKKFNYEFLEI